MTAQRQSRSHPAPPRRNRRPPRRGRRAAPSTPTLSRELAELEPIVAAIRALRAKERERADLDAMLADPVARRGNARDGRRRARSRRERGRGDGAGDPRSRCCPRTPADEGNVILEVRAGTGGDEAALFAGDLFRMYVKYAESKGWKVEVLSASEGTAGGYKEIIAEIAGRGAFARLKFESGVHRVQRVPATETQGRIHTSAATVAVLPEAQEIDLEINDADLKIDTMRSQRRRRPARQQDRIRRSASPICRPASWWRCRKSARSTATAPRRWRCCARAFSTRSNQRADDERAAATGARRSARATARSASAPIISRKGG